MEEGSFTGGFEEDIEVNFGDGRSLPRSLLGNLESPLPGNFKGHLQTYAGEHLFLESTAIGDSSKDST
jgi:hypothetical protein